jgi:hypothetical protein
MGTDGACGLLFCTANGAAPLEKSDVPITHIDDEVEVVGKGRLQ